MFKDLFSNEKSAKTILLVVVVAVVTFLAAYFILGRNRDEDRLRFSSEVAFDMIDPENPTTVKDNIVTLTKEMKQIKNDICLAKGIQEELMNKISILSGSRSIDSVDLIDSTNIDVATEINIDRLRPILNNYRTNEIFDYTVKSSRCQTSIDILEQSPVYNLYTKFIKKYDALLAAILEKKELPPFFKSSLSDAFDFYDEYRTLRDTITKPKSEIHLKTLASLKKQTITLLEMLMQQINLKKQEYETAIRLKEEKFNAQFSAYSKSRKSINQLAIIFGIVAFVIVALVLYIYGANSRNKIIEKMDFKTNPESFQEYKASMWHSVYTITVLLLIITIFILGLGSILQENTLAALLGGIAGYVLNNKQSPSTT